MKSALFLVLLFTGTAAHAQYWGRLVYTQQKTPLHVSPTSDSAVNEYLVSGTKIKIDYCGANWCAVFWSHARQRELKQARGFVQLAHVARTAPPRRENPRLQRVLRRSRSDSTPQVRRDPGLPPPE